MHRNTTSVWKRKVGILDNVKKKVKVLYWRLVDKETYLPEPSETIYHQSLLRNVKMNLEDLVVFFFVVLLMLGKHLPSHEYLR